MNNNAKIIMLVLIVLGAGFFIRSQIAKVKMTGVHTLTVSFCNDVKVDTSLEKVMDQVGESAFEQIEFKDTTGKKINAANKGTFSPSKSSGFESGDIDVSFVANSNATVCSLKLQNRRVISKQVLEPRVN